MTKLLTALCLLLLFGQTGSAQELTVLTEDRRRLQKIVLVVPVEVKFPPLIRRATLAGREIPIDKTSRSPDSPLRIVVIDQRRATDPRDLPPANFRVGKGGEIQPSGCGFETVKLFRTQNSPVRRFSHCQYSMEVFLCQSFV